MGTGENDTRRVSNFKINVTVFRRIFGEPLSEFYDGEIETHLGTTSLRDASKRTVSPGLFKSLDHVAEAVAEVVSEDTNGMTELLKKDLTLKYSSNPDEVFGERGYSDSSGVYTQRTLNDSEMERLVLAVDAKIRPVFYKASRKK